MRHNDLGENLEQLAPDVFALRIVYAHEESDPAAVFMAMGQLLSAFDKLHADLARSVDASLRPVSVLHDVKATSIKAVVRILTQSSESESLTHGHERGLSRYIIRATRAVVGFIDGRDEIESESAVASLQQAIQAEASAESLTHIPQHENIPKKLLLEDVNAIAQALSALPKGDRAEFQSSDGAIRLNRSFKLPPDRIVELISSEHITQHPVLTLVVKKPDYLGNSQWEFRRSDGQPIKAAIRDAGWLKRFQNREIRVMPGDALSAEVSIEVRRMATTGEIVFEEYAVTRVIDVIEVKQVSQESWLDFNER